jgi:acyl-CoA oxidase
LYIAEKCYGVHAFVVPIRCPKTHRTLPGVLIGDCGPKFSLNAIDIGFLMFNKVKIPISNLLDKVSGINEKG